MNKILNKIFYSKSKGLSVQSILIGSVIFGIISTIAISSLWSATESTKSNTIKSTVKEQLTYLQTNISELKYLNDSNNDYDYLDELVRKEKVSHIKFNSIFNEPQKIQWKIRKIIENNSYVFRLSISSTNPYDQKLIENALKGFTISSKYHIH